MNDTDTTTRAFRAARAWAGASQHEMAEAIGTSVTTIKRIELGHRDLTPPERMFVARYCGVPEGFMTGGFDGIRTPVQGLSFVMTKQTGHRMAHVVGCPRLHDGTPVEPITVLPKDARRCGSCKPDKYNLPSGE